MEIALLQHKRTLPPLQHPRDYPERQTKRHTSFSLLPLWVTYSMWRGSEGFDWMEENFLYPMKLSTAHSVLAIFQSREGK